MAAAAGRPRARPPRIGESSKGEGGVSGAPLTFASVEICTLEGTQKLAKNYPLLPGRFQKYLQLPLPIEVNTRC